MLFDIEKEVLAELQMAAESLSSPGLKAVYATPKEERDLATELFLKENLMNLPTVEELTNLFKTAKAMKGKGARILKEHFNFPNYTASASELAEKLGYKKFNIVNLTYGNFIKSLAYEYGWSMEDKKQVGFCWLYFILDFNPPKRGEHWKLTLRDTTVQALKNIGW